MTPSSLKLPLQFDISLLQRDLSQVLSSEFIPHFNTRYYEGDWNVVPLRSIEGRADHIYPDPTAQKAFADTAILKRCLYVQEVLATFKCPFQSVRFLRLKVGSSIKEHKDYNLSLEDGEARVHIPVVTNPEVEFVLDGKRIDMKEGECWYHNFNLSHRIANRGTTDRVHLVLDCNVNDWFRELLFSAIRPA
ncbi:MAG: Aspartyl/asparaginyl beta-hydroxylase [Verrucomicrobiales bacterium]|nr:Aspartyl/asparaginyl beta-hydroxylase [Verrucomicrobiales bacterium]